MFILFRGLRNFSGAEAQRLACGSACFRNSSAPPIIVVGILGGIVKHDATPTSAQVEAFIRQQIQSTTMK